MLNLLFVFPLTWKTVSTVQLKKPKLANPASRLRNLRLTRPQEQLVALRYDIRLKLYFEISTQIYFIACARTLEFCILCGKAYNILKCLSAGYDCLRWPTILACLDHLHLKFASTKFRSKNAPLNKNVVSVKYKECSWEPYLCIDHVKTARDKSPICLAKRFRLSFSLLILMYLAEL